MCEKRESPLWYGTIVASEEGRRLAQVSIRLHSATQGCCGRGAPHRLHSGPAWRFPCGPLPPSHSPRLARKPPRRRPGRFSRRVLQEWSASTRPSDICLERTRVPAAL